MSFKYVRKKYYYSGTSYNEDVGTMKINLLYQVCCYLKVQTKYMYM